MNLIDIINFPIP